MNRSLRLYSLLAGLVTLFLSYNASAETLLKSFILAENKSGDVATIVNETKDKLTGAGFEVV
ncbi:hypothetical protein, partial [Kaarinaea lacus]